ncbi:MAG: thiamine pyrophosphate-dependent enzyme, partial [Deltaproteobacteria bacterium]|nr:thiamine pyrophosphate-dependent enzyme [Deltaproteobacteria bacterium]
PMHWGSKEINIVSQGSPTGSQFLPAVGLALALKKDREKACVYVSAGEGACCQGDFHEALNWASKDKLPVVFVVQNNHWAISVNFKELWCQESIVDVTKAYTYSESVAGQQLFDLFEKLHKMRLRALQSEGPSVLEVFVPRLCSHSISDDQTKYRDAVQILEDEKLDPVKPLSDFLISQGLNENEIKSLENKLQTEIDAAVLQAERESDPSSDEIYLGALTFDESFSSPDDEESIIDSQSYVLVDAINKGLSQIMQENPKVVVFGEDVAHGKGGVFGATRNLTDKFGTERCFNSPLAESSIVGVAIGLALKGYKPVVEIQFGDYIWPAMNQIRNELNTISYRSKGDFKTPVIIRVAVGGYIRGAFYHSQNIEATFTHFPGIVTVMPSTAGDAYGLLMSAAKSSNPVLFLEHKGLYRAPVAKSQLKKYVPLGKANCVKQGAHLTIISYGLTLHKAVLVAKRIEEEHQKSVEVIDLRTLYPLDEDTVFSSVKKTGKALVVHEDTLFMGLGAEIVSKIVENCFEFLDAPVRRVGALDVPGICQAPNLEKAILPDEAKIYKLALEVLNF